VPGAPRTVRLLLATAIVAGLLVAAEAAPVTATPEAGTPDWRMVSTGGSHSCGIRTSGRLYCWGGDAYGELGDGGSNTTRHTPTEVAGGHTDWTTVSAGGFHTCGRRSSGRLYCWGRDANGQLGNGMPTTNRSTPGEVAGGHTDWVGVSAGDEHTCARRSTGRLYCWGDDERGSVGFSLAFADEPAPVQVAGGRTDWASVSAGGGHTCAVRATGQLFCWGRDGSGQVGDGGPAGLFASRSIPFEVSGARTDWAAVSAGNAHTCARRTTGLLFCWGADQWGQVGDGGTNTDRLAPRQVLTFFTDWTNVAAGGSHTCARRSTGRLYCWGYDQWGQVGDGEPLANRAAPTEVEGHTTTWTQVDVGNSHSCARINARRISCWGNDGAGLLGNGEPDQNQAAPVEIEA